MTQQYQPIAWQDETTSQQGTLINAERLMKMQTAHHYADGLEEVDAVPTGNPGVTWHKIVYCTADNTIYRWDGSHWTADIDDKTKQLLDDEIARATEAEGDLAHDVLELQNGKLDKKYPPTTYWNAYVAKGSTQSVLAISDAASEGGAIASGTIVSRGSEGEINAKIPATLSADTVINYGWATANLASQADTLAGYGITDAYTKSQADTLLANKLDITGTYAKTVNGQSGDVTLNDTNISCSPALVPGIYNVHEMLNLLYVNKVDADELNTYYYNKDDTDTLLAAKQNTLTWDSAPTEDSANPVTSGGIYTALGNGSVTKIGTANVGTDTKPIKLVAGVPTAVTNDLVDTATAQSIEGAKTFTSGSVAIKTASEQYDQVPASHIQTAYQIKGSDDNNLAIIEHWAYTGGSSALNIYNRVKRNGVQPLPYVRVNVSATGVGSVQVPTPSAGAGSTEIATVGYIDGYTPMVRTTGNQTIGGQKTLTNPPIMFAPKTVGITLTTGYYKIAKFVVSPRWYAVGLIATRGASTSIACVTGSLNGGVWTLNSSAQTAGATPERLKIGACTIDGENYLVAHITSSTALNILILGSTSGSNTTLDSLEIVTPESITPGADYVEGDYII